jgi:hypothetical protein
MKKSNIAEQSEVSQHTSRPDTRRYPEIDQFSDQYPDSDSNQSESQPPRDTNNANQKEISPIFEEIKGMDVGGAVNVLIQVAQQAQSAGVLTIRDSVVVAHAISILHPGSI